MLTHKNFNKIRVQQIYGKYIYSYYRIAELGWMIHKRPELHLDTVNT